MGKITTNFAGLMQMDNLETGLRSFYKELCRIDDIPNLEDFFCISDTKRQAILELLLVKTPYADERDIIRRSISNDNGQKYQEQFEMARLLAWQGYNSTDYFIIKDIQKILAEHEAIDLRVNVLNDCKGPWEIRKKLGLYKHLTKGSLERFYSEGVEIFKIQRYSVGFQPGIWENIGGIDIVMANDGKSLMDVGGKIHEYTEIRTVQGAKDAKPELDRFKDELGIHPANLCLLLYLELGRFLGHDAATIAGTTSYTYNARQIDSNLYLIPRNHFRLKMDQDTQKYEISMKTRTTILDKFRNKNEAVRDAFLSLAEYLESADTSSDLDHEPLYLRADLPKLAVV